MILKRVGSWMPYTRSVRFSGRMVEKRAAMSVSGLSMSRRYFLNHAEVITDGARRSCLVEWYSFSTCASRSQTRIKGKGMSKIYGMLGHSALRLLAGYRELSRDSLCEHRVRYPDRYGLGDGRDMTGNSKW